MSSRLVRSAALLLVLATAGSASPAAAQYRAAQALQRPVNYEVGVGATVPAGRVGRALGTGLNALAAVTVHSGALPVGVRASASYQHFPAKTGLASDTVAITGGSGQLLGAQLAGTLGIPTGTLRPYVLAGGGYYQFRSRQEVRELVGGDVVASRTARRSESSWGLTGGVGMRGGLGALDAFVEIRVDELFTNDALDDAHVRVVPLTIGLRF